MRGSSAGRLRPFPCSKHRTSLLLSPPVEVEKEKVFKEKVFKGKRMDELHTDSSPLITSFWCLRWDQTEDTSRQFLYSVESLKGECISCWLNSVSSNLKFIVLQKDIKIKGKYEWSSKIGPSPLPPSLSVTRPFGSAYYIPGTIKLLNP